LDLIQQIELRLLSVKIAGILN